jgi:hypothetical protein
MRRFLVAVTCACAPAVFLLAGFSPAHAQQAQSYSAFVFWGQGGGPGADSFVESAIGHNQNGAAAGEVNAAEAGILYNLGSGSLTLQTIGSQTVVSNTITGNGNSVNITANQTSTSTGDISNTGSVGVVPRP